MFLFSSLDESSLLDRTDEVVVRNCGLQSSSVINSRRACFFRSQREVPNSRLIVWPGYETAIAQYEYNVLLKTEIAFAVMRKETAYDIWQQCLQDQRTNGSDPRVRVAFPSHIAVAIARVIH